MRRGYTERVKSTIEQGPGGLGTELGRLCVEHGYSVTEVADALSVTRSTVYSWFRGDTEPSKHLAPKVHKIIDLLREKETRPPVQPE